MAADRVAMAIFKFKCIWNALAYNLESLKSDFDMNHSHIYTRPNLLILHRIKWPRDKPFLVCITIRRITRKSDFDNFTQT